MLFLDARPRSRTGESFSHYIRDLFVKKRTLVKLEVDFIPQVRSQWASILLDNQTDRAKAEAAIEACYQYVGLDRPTILWAAHPIDVLKILINRLDFENVSGMISDRLWNSGELSIQQAIDPQSTAMVLEHLHRQQIDSGTSIDQINSIADRMNELIFDRMTKIYSEIYEDSLPSPLQDYQVSDLSYLDYFAKIGVNIPQIQLLVDLATSCGWCWTFKKIAILTPKANQVKVDRDGEVVQIIYDGFDLLSF